MRFAAVAILLLLSSSAWCADLVGRASVIDGDTIEIHGTRIRLWGIDAPESDQLCRGPDSEQYRCGAKAAAALATLFYAVPRPVTCTPINLDQYGRTVATCTVGSPGPDLGHWLVANGHALDWPLYSRGKYSDAQREAKEAGGAFGPAAMSSRGCIGPVFVQPEDRPDVRTARGPLPETFKAIDSTAARAVRSGPLASSSKLRAGGFNEQRRRPPSLEDLVRRVSALETARGSEDLADRISTVADRISALEKKGAAENLVESITALGSRITALESTQNLAERITVLETTHRTEGLEQKVRAAEDTHTRENVAPRLMALEALPARVQGLEAAQQTFRTELDGLKTAALRDLQKLVYEHAAQWLRMVNTTVWTLNSIFLVGSILALNGASQTTSIHWKHTAGYIVFGLCVVWFIADVTYTVSGWRARHLLSAIENTRALRSHRLYSWPANWFGWLETPYWLIWILFQVATYVPVIGIAYLAYTYFIHVCVDVSGKAVVVCEYPARWPWLVWWFGEQFAGLPIRMAKPGTCALTAARREVFSNVP